MKNVIKISIAKDFSIWLAGRYRNSGEVSAEALREDHIAPALREAGESGVVEVSLDGMMGMGASCLEEAFGGLVRRCGFSSEELKTRLVLKGGFDADHEDIRTYIREADERKEDDHA